MPIAQRGAAIEISALGENDTVTFVDKKDIRRRLTYRPGDEVETKILDSDD
ncbi:MAG: hypothetical protein GDA56_15305 [Hormoscilla sp. GM7CHS1pb]|nr:hypothetical protein [Hormoscilla sp. GM7CHS1pb]